jgi:hypothetical protein
MATNLKGKGRVVSLLLLHGEKIAIGVVGLIALMFVYKSFKIDKLPDNFQADKLQTEITQTSSEIKGFNWEKAVAEHPDKIKKFQPIPANGEMAVNPKDYVPLDAKGQPNFAIEGSIVPPLILRDDPVLINVVDPRAVGGSGLFAFVDEEIRKKQVLRQAEETAEAEKKAIAKQKKDAANANAGAAGKRRPESPGEGANEPLDPLHPKRRPVSGYGGGRPGGGGALQGGERIERAYWACVTAKVPIREQLKRYQDALEKARGADPTRDFPSYLGFYVERAEVLPGKELAWSPVPLYDGQRQSIAQNKTLSKAPNHGIHKGVYDNLMNAAQQFWATGISPDVIDERFAEYPLTLPLPPLIGREWGSEATHPDIPLAINTPPLEDENLQRATGDAAQQPAAADAGGEFGSAAPTQGSVGPGMGPGAGFGTGRPGGEYPGAGLGRGRMMGPEGGMGPGMGPGGRRIMAGPGGGPEGGGAYRGSGGGQAAAQHQVLPKGVDYYLLRFFDFTVEPGKKYKYRVKLVFNDPNFGMPEGVLAASVLDRQAKEVAATKKKKSDLFYRVVDKWSDPTPTVGIPMAGNVRLADTKIPAGVNDEPNVKLLVEAFDVDEAGLPIQAALESDKTWFRRGNVVNMVQDAEYLVDPTMIDTKANFQFLTGMTLLDVDGGTKLSRDMTVPSRILVMGSAGEMYIRNEIDDKPYVESHRKTFEKTTDKNGKPLGPEVPGGSPKRPPRR